MDRGGAHEGAECKPDPPRAGVRRIRRSKCSHMPKKPTAVIPSRPLDPASGGPVLAVCQRPRIDAARDTSESKTDDATSTDVHAGIAAKRRRYGSGTADSAEAQSSSAVQSARARYVGHTRNGEGERLYRLERWLREVSNASVWKGDAGEITVGLGTTGLG